MDGGAGAPYAVGDKRSRSYRPIADLAALPQPGRIELFASEAEAHAADFHPQKPERQARSAR